MHETRRKERFSLAYIMAVAAVAGYEVLEPRVDDDSVDGVIAGREFGRPKLDFQVKATARGILRDDHLAFPLPLKNYDDLRTTDLLVPRILVVVLMPAEEVEWLGQSEEQLCLRRCGYWRSLRGEPAVANTASVTVDLPRSNVFSVEGLRAIMARIARREEL